MVKKLLGERFIAGTNRHDAVLVARKLARNGVVPIVNVLGEHARKKETADAARNEYEQLIRELGGIANARIAVKPSFIGALISSEALYENFSKIAHAAKQNRVSLEIDIEDEGLAHHTCELALVAHTLYGLRARAAIAARLTSDQEIEKLVSQHIPVRLVKGAYANTTNPLHNSTEYIHKRFHKLIGLLLQRGTQPALQRTMPLSFVSSLKKHGAFTKSRTNLKYSFCW